MSAINYTYYVTIGALETQVYPSGDWSLKVTKAEEDFPFCKDYRIKFDGDFIFSGDDYNLLRDTAGCCDKIDLRIQCNGLDYWFGYFSYPYDFEVDEDRCQISGTPKPFDKYYYFDLHADDKEDQYADKTFTYQNDFPDAPAAAQWYDGCVNCRLLWDFIYDLGTGLPVWPFLSIINAKSTFFNNDAFPDLTDPYPDGPGAINYVTGFAQKLNYVVMAMANNVCDTGIASEWPAWSWNDIMEIVHNTFNTWWYIDEQGDVRVEHIYFWELYFPVSYDLTTIDGGRWIKNTSKYDYRKEEIPAEEWWLFSEMMDTFENSSFKYYGCYLPGKTRYIKEYSLSNLTTDLEYIAPGTLNLLTSPDCADVSASDYMFIRCIPAADVPVTYPALPICGPDYVAWFSRYLGDGNDHLNAHLSPLNLIINYWMHDRPLWTGYILLLIEHVIFESTWKNLRQTELCFPVCCDNEVEILDVGAAADPRYLYQFGIDFNEFITTQYGGGELYTGTIKDGMLCLQLIYEDSDCEESATEWSSASEL